MPSGPADVSSSIVSRRWNAWPLASEPSRYIEQRVIGHAVRKRDALLHDGALRAAAIDEPDFLPAGIGEINLATAVDRQVVRAYTFREHGLGSIGRVGHDTLAPVLAGIEAPVRPEHQTIGAAGVFFEDADFAIRGDRSL